MEDPVAVYQANLDAVSQLLWQRDWDGVLEHLAVPNEVVLADGSARLDDREAMLRHLQVYRASFDQMGAEGYHRLCLWARHESDEENTIFGRHRTYTLRGGRHLTRPYESEMRLRRFPSGIWKACALRVFEANATIAAIAGQDLQPLTRDGRSGS
jgi:hypothetical protein